jgi:hypothetical protein
VLTLSDHGWTSRRRSSATLPRKSDGIGGSAAAVVVVLIDSSIHAGCWDIVSRQILVRLSLFLKATQRPRND